MFFGQEVVYLECLSSCGMRVIRKRRCESMRSEEFELLGLVHGLLVITLLYRRRTFSFSFC